MLLRLRLSGEDFVLVLLKRVLVKVAFDVLFELARKDHRGKYRVPRLAKCSTR